MRPAVPTGYTCDRRQKSPDELLTSRTLPGGRGEHELPLARGRKGLRGDQPRRDSSGTEETLLRIRL